MLLNMAVAASLSEALILMCSSCFFTTDHQSSPNSCISSQVPKGIMSAIHGTYLAMICTYISVQSRITYFCQSTTLQDAIQPAYSEGISNPGPQLHNLLSRPIRFIFRGTCRCANPTEIVATTVFIHKGKCFHTSDSFYTLMYNQ